jgi:hypothetical protein
MDSKIKKDIEVVLLVVFTLLLSIIMIVSFINGIIEIISGPTPDCWYGFTLYMAFIIVPVLAISYLVVGFINLDEDLDNL